MLEQDELQYLDTLGGEQAKQYTIELVSRLRTSLQSSEVRLKFEQTKNQALTFELMRLKQWRFGTSSESIDSTQTQLFDAKLDATFYGLFTDATGSPNIYQENAKIAAKLLISFKPTCRKRRELSNSGVPGSWPPCRFDAKPGPRDESKCREFRKN